MDVRIKRRKKRRNHMGVSQIKWWYLKGVKKKTVFNKRSWREGLDNHKEVQMISEIKWYKRL